MIVRQRCETCPEPVEVAQPVFLLFRQPMLPWERRTSQSVPVTGYRLSGNPLTTRFSGSQARASTAAASRRESLRNRRGGFKIAPAD